MSDPMQEIRASFFVECDELLEALNDALRTMDEGDASSETINVAFRAVHSIKGGAGAFGLDALVAFAHSFETVMDEVRAGRLTPDATCIGLFFQCGDTLSDLVNAARNDSALDPAATEPLLARLSDLGGGSHAEPQEQVAFQPMTISLDLDLDFGPAADPVTSPEPTGLREFEIAFSPLPELYRSGNEPLHLLTALSDLGPMQATCRLSAEPEWAAYDPATALLAWQIHLKTEADADAIAEIFEFVDGLCHLAIAETTAPAAPAKAMSAAAQPFEPESPNATSDVSFLTATETSVTTAERSTPAVTLTAKPEAAPEKPEKVAQTPPSALLNAEPSSGNVPSAAATVRVDLERIDRLVNLVGELVINQAMLSQSLSAESLTGNTKIASGLEEFQQLTRDIQDSVMAIRAQPVKSLFQRMARIVREASSAVHKRVRFHTEGEGTEIDKTVIERLADPLTHMIRNAVDHGLELEDQRVSAGKAAEGNVTLRAFHRSGRVIIEIADDGAGIDRARVLGIAVEKGLIAPDADLSESEIDNLLFLPGFSTAKEISNLSGRGVGMDVVKNAIGALGGRIVISSKRGEGTTFSISLPLTLAVLDGMVVRVAGETLVVPLSAVSETLALQTGDVRPLGPKSQVIRVRDSFVPLVDLGTELGYTEPRKSYERAIVLLIAQEDGSRAALVVDEIEDQRQVVIKGLHDSYGHVPGVAAATILGDGQIALILDPVDLLANATGVTRVAVNLKKIA